MSKYRKAIRLLALTFTACCGALLPGTCAAQQQGPPPLAQFMAAAGQMPQPSPQAMPTTTPAPDTAPLLTRAAAEQLALRNNPRSSIARLLALAQGQVTREVRSAELPNLTGALTAVDTHTNDRITAGFLNNPYVFNRAAGGVMLRQLITDFGRTHNLILSAQASQQAEVETQLATEQDIVLAVDQAFYQALIAQAVLKVAQQAVATLKNTSDEVRALTESKLRSNLDLDFANVQLSQARLFLLDAQNNAQVAMDNLDVLLGSERRDIYSLQDDSPAALEPAPEDAEPLVQLAFRSRPDLAALNEDYIAANRLTTATRELWLPTASAIVASGGTPDRSNSILTSWYAAAGANIDVPLFNGFLYNARAREAELREGAAQERVRDLRDVIARDVRAAVLSAQTNFQRIAVSEELLKESNLALELAKDRYQLGLSGIIELSQAQLAQTQAEIGNANARYLYRISQATIRYQTGQ